MPHQPPPIETQTEPTTETLDQLFEQLERALSQVFTADSSEPDAGRGIFQEALLAVTARRREIEKPGEGLGGIDRLRRMKYWHERQQSVCEAVDQVLLRHLDRHPAGPVPAAPALLLGQVIDQLPPRCRSLLRLRYGLDVASDPIAVKLSERKTGIRKTTGRCLTALSRLLVERGLAERS